VESRGLDSKGEKHHHKEEEGRKEGDHRNTYGKGGREDRFEKENMYPRERPTGKRGVGKDGTISIGRRRRGARLGATVQATPVPRSFPPRKVLGANPAGQRLKGGGMKSKSAQGLNWGAMRSICADHLSSTVSLAMGGLSMTRLPSLGAMVVRLIMVRVPRVMGRPVLVMGKVHLAYAQGDSKYGPGGLAYGQGRPGHGQEGAAYGPSAFGYGALGQEGPPVEEDFHLGYTGRVHQSTYGTHNSGTQQVAAGRHACTSVSAVFIKSGSNRAEIVPVQPYLKRLVLVEMHQGAMDLGRWLQSGCLFSSAHRFCAHRQCRAPTEDWGADNGDTDRLSWAAGVHLQVTFDHKHVLSGKLPSLSESALS
jgi:hypothetical protein